VMARAHLPESCRPGREASEVGGDVDDAPVGCSFTGAPGRQRRHARSLRAIRGNGTITRPGPNERVARRGLVRLRFDVR
jgi:hypothetical protein